MSRVIVVHGWGGSPNNDWLPWLEMKLTEKGYQVFVPEMPNTEHPKITPWLDKLKETVVNLHEDDILIGHSIGCQAILRLLEKSIEKVKPKLVILVAPWQYLILDENEEQVDADPWLSTPIDMEKVKENAKLFIAVFSDNDPFVPLKKNIEYYKQTLNPEIIVKEKMGHFTTGDKASEIPFILDLIK